MESLYVCQKNESGFTPLYQLHSVSETSTDTIEVKGGNPFSLNKTEDLLDMFAKKIDLTQAHMNRDLDMNLPNTKQVKDSLLDYFND